MWRGCSPFHSFIPRGDGACYVVDGMRYCTNSAASWLRQVFQQNRVELSIQYQRGSSRPLPLPLLRSSVSRPRWRPRSRLAPWLFAIRCAVVRCAANGAGEVCQTGFAEMCAPVQRWFQGKLSLCKQMTKFIYLFIFLLPWRLHTSMYQIIRRRF